MQSQISIMSPEMPPSDAVRVPNEAVDDPHRLACQFLNAYGQHDGELTLRHHRDQWLRWDGSAYRDLRAAELQAELTTFAKAEMNRANLAELAEAKKRPPVARKVTRRMIADVVHALASLTMLPSRTEPPCWIDGDDGERAAACGLTMQRRSSHVGTG